MIARKLGFVVLVSFLASIGGEAHADFGLALQGSMWQLGTQTSSGYGIDGQFRSERVALQFGYSDPRLRGAEIPESGYATPPNLRVEVNITPFPNRYVAPFLSGGFGFATYASDRVSLLGGGGVAIGYGEWATLEVAARLLAPTPGDVVTDIKSRMAQEAPAADCSDCKPMDMLSDYASDYYNLDNYEIRVGLRLSY